MPGLTEQAAEHSEPRSHDTVAQAVAELDRRDAARKAERKAAKAERTEQVGKPAEAQETDADAEDDDDPDTRQVEKPKKAESDKEEKPPRKAKGEEEADDAPDDDQDDEAKESDEDEADPEDEEDEDDAKPKPKRASAADDPDSVEVEHEGKKYHVHKELKDSLLRHSDYTQKTQQLAQERQVVHQAYSQANNSLQQFATAQNTLMQFAQAMIGEEPSIDLARSDPSEYLRQRNMHETRIKALQHISQQGQTMQQESERLNEARTQQDRQTNLQTLVQHAPELRDNGNLTKFYQVASQYLTQFGFSERDGFDIADARTMLLVRRLLQLEHGAKQRDKTAGDVQKRLANVPAKALKPGAADAQGSKNRSNESAKKRFMASGRSMKDVERYLASKS